MRECVSCFCPVERHQKKCFACSLHAPPWSWRERNEGDLDPCRWCESPVCALHASQHQLRRGLCARCYDTRDSYSECSDNDSDCSEQPDQHRHRWDSDDLEEDAGVVADGWSEAQQEEDVAPVLHTLVSTPGKSEEKCTICLDAMGADTHVVTLPCTGHHEYHTHCINTWLAKSKHCPLCNTLVHVCLQ